MADITQCINCRTKYKTAGLKPGAKLRCKRCGRVFAVADDPRILVPAGDGGGKCDTEALPAVLGDEGSLSRAGLEEADGIIDFGDDGIEDTPAGGSRPGEDSATLVAEALRSLNDRRKYVTEDELGRGGMGKILRVVDRDIRREVAMKVMLKDHAEDRTARFIEEAQITGQMEHPNIVPVHELGIDGDGNIFFTMKLVRGRSLAEIVRELRTGGGAAERRHSLSRLIGIFISVCHALEFAHWRGVVHRDLKPSNIMIGDFGEVMVMDWGLARAGAARAKPRNASSVVRRSVRSKTRSEEARQEVDEELNRRVSSLRGESDSDLTRDGDVMGTPLYMPPEQADGRIADIDERSDIYSLGAILYTLLALHPPVTGKNVDEVLQNVRSGAIRPPEERAPKRNIPRELSAIALKCLAFDQLDRYQHVRDLREDVELYLEGHAVSAKEDTPLETMAKLIRRNRGASLVAAISLLVLATFGAFFTYANVQARRQAEDNERLATEMCDAAEKNLTAFTAEQNRRREAEKKSAPAYVEMARGSVRQGDTETAWTVLESAIAANPRLPQAYLLKAQLLIAQDKYREAATELLRMRALQELDEDCIRLYRLCQSAAGGLTDHIKEGFAEVLMHQGMYSFATKFAIDEKKALEAGRKKLGSVWPESKNALNLGSNGLYCSLSNNKSVTDLSPLRGIPLRRVELAYTNVSDLTPLEGMELEEINLFSSKVETLAPLKGMPLKRVEIGDTRICDLSPLAGAPLRYFAAQRSLCNDLSPLKGAPLEVVYLYRCRISDLSPLKGMPIKELYLDEVSCLSSLEPLRDMPLKVLGIANCSGLSDIGPLAGMPLAILHMEKTKIADLSPLTDLRLVTISFTPAYVTAGMEALRNMPGLNDLRLVSVNAPSMTKEEFFRRYDAGEFKQK